MKPKVIFLDWHKTLSNSVFWEHLKNENPEKYKLITNSFMGSFGELVYSWMRGEFTSEDMSKKIASDTKLSEKYVLEELKKSAKEMVFAEDGVIPLVHQLKSGGIKIVVATDNMDTFTRWTVPQMKLDDIFNGILNSWDIGGLKRDFKSGKSKFFGKFLKTNKLRPSECALIDDSEDKENTLTDFGLNYIKINSTSEAVEVLKALL